MSLSIIALNYLSVKKSKVSSQSSAEDRKRLVSLIDDFIALKDQRKIVCLTAYTASMATRLDAHCDLILVGDSVAMVVYGEDTTNTATIEMMARHGKAVRKAAAKALVVVDMPAGSYEESANWAVNNAHQLISQTDAHALKLEGGEAMASHVAAIVKSGIPVMGHIGLLPQQVASPDEFRVTGRDSFEEDQLIRDLQALEAAGCFAIVIECVVEEVARKLAQMAKVPLIGIGASAACHGQILVTDDLIGMYDKFTPKFVRKYSAMSSAIDEAVAAYRSDLIAGDFPSDKECFMKR